MAPVEAEAPYVREEQPLGEVMQDRVVELFGMQQAAKERRQAMFKTLAATARLQSQLGKASPKTPPKAAPKVLVDRLQTQLGKSSPTTPPKTAPKVLGLSASSTVEAPTLEVEASALDVEREGMVLEFASQFVPPCGTERQYLGMGPGQPASPATGRGEESEGDRTLKAAKSAARRLLEVLVAGFKRGWMRWNHRRRPTCRSPFWRALVWGFWTLNEPMWRRIWQWRSHRLLQWHHLLPYLPKLQGIYLHHLAFRPRCIEIVFSRTRLCGLCRFRLRWRTLLR